MKDIAIYGFGGFGKEVVCILKSINALSPTWNIIGFFDDGIPSGTENRYGKVLGDIKTLNNYPSQLAIVMAIANPNVLEKIYSSITNTLISFPNIIAPDIIFYDKVSLQMGIGNIIIYGSRLSCDIKLGNFNICNSSTYIGHDVNIGDFNVFQPETRLSGGVTVGDKNLFGTRSTVIQYIKIGSNTHIGSGSMVLRKTQDGFLYYGNPAKKVEGYK